jgi:heptosyltransferase-3
MIGSCSANSGMSVGVEFYLFRKQANLCLVAPLLTIYPNGPMQILFISSNRIGDAVISTGLLDHLIRTYPKCRITVACGRVAEGVFARMPNRERTILIDKRPYHLHWLPLWRDVVGTLWDLVVDLRGSALAFLVPTRRRAVMRRLPGRKIEQLGALLKLDPPPLPVVWTASADRARAAYLLPADRLVIGLGPTANWPSKVWPAERFAALFHALAEEPFRGAVPAIFGGPGESERAMANPLLKMLPDAIDLCGKLSLPEAASCIQRCALYVGNDSGLMHLAAAAGAPTIGLCGATIDRAEEMAPVGRLATWALAGGPSMADLSVAEAFLAARRLLSDTDPLSA